MKNNSLIVFCLLIAFQNFTFAQSDINNYKYVSVSDRFDFLKTSDQYQLNSLTKFLLNKSGFTVLDGQIVIRKIFQKTAVYCWMSLLKN